MDLPWMISKNDCYDYQLSISIYSQTFKFILSFTGSLTKNQSGHLSFSNVIEQIRVIIANTSLQTAHWLIMVICFAEKLASKITQSIKKKTKGKAMFSEIILEH